MSNRRLQGVVAAARLDFAEVRRSRWLLFCIAVYAVLAGVFVVAAMHESALFGFTGIGRVLVSLTHALLALLPLLALMATGQVVNHARDDGTLELLFSHPISRSGWLVAVTLVRLGALLVPLALLMLAVGVGAHVAFEEAIPWDYLARCVVVSGALLACFTGLGMYTSTVVRNHTKAMMWSLLLWVAGVALLDFALAGLMLQWRLEPRAVFALAVLNPVQDARMALLASADPELTTLGPVGFYLANQIGTRALLALGLGWPLVLGATSWCAALWRFNRRDVV